MGKKARNIIIIVSTVLFTASVGMNIYIFSKYSKIKDKVDTIVDNKVDDIKDTINDKKDEINTDYEKSVTELEYDIHHAEIIYKDIDPLIDEDGRTFVSIKVNDEEHKFYLADDITDSHKQTAFLTDKLNYVTEQRELDNIKYNEMIDEINAELEKARADLKRDLTDSEMQELVNNTKKKFIRFGIDVWAMDNLPVTQWINTGKVDKLGYFSGGIGGSILINNQFSVRLSVGMQQQIDNSFNPTVGISIGYYFK